MVKALAMATLGLLLGMIGIDQIPVLPVAYGVVELGDGIGVVPVAVAFSAFLRSSPPPAKTRRRHQPTLR